MVPQQFELDKIPYQNAVTVLCFYCLSNALPFIFLSTPVHASTLFIKMQSLYRLTVPPLCFLHSTNLLKAELVQSAERLATGWTVRRSNTGGGDFLYRTPFQTVPGGPSSLI
jgi:hypothetical protein